MQIGPQRKWLTGEVVQPWELPKLRYSHSQMPEKLVYKYSLFDTVKEEAIWEREPSRELKILPPENYAAYKQEMILRLNIGESLSGDWRNVNEVYLVNGHIEKSDANFVGDLNFHQIGEEHIFIGPYPMTEADIQKMYERGVTGIFNVQTEIDHEHRGIDWERMCSYYAQRAMEPVHFPIHDFNQGDLIQKLYDAACELNRMINERGLDVYVHCTAGMGRAPASVLVYLCLFRGMEPEQARVFVKSYR